MNLMKQIKEKIKESKFFFVSFTAHLLILFLVSGIVIVNPTMRKTVFRGILQMGGGGKAETPEWETQKQLPSSKPVDIPSAAKQEIKVTDAKVVINTKIADAAKSSAVVKPLDIVGAGGSEGGGMGTGIGKGIGAGIGIFSARMNRTEMAKKYGGTPLTEVAVNKGLEYLFKNQKPDGSWIDEKRSRNNGSYTGLSLLAFLGAGFRCDSPHKYAKTIRNAVEYLVKTQTDEGIVGNVTSGNDSMYTHFICTMALSEAYLVGGASGIKERVTRCVDATIKSQEQNPKGAWRYGPNAKDGDISVSGWGLMALKDAYYSEIKKEEVKKAIDKAMEFVIACKGAYTPELKYDRWSYGSCPAIGIFCLAMNDKLKHPSAKAILDLLTSIDISAINSYYAMYYFNLALFQVGGGSWDNWNKKFRGFIVPLQNEDGSFKPYPGATWYEKDLNATYTTAMAVLSLEVYYRYLPIYQVVQKKE